MSKDWNDKSLYERKDDWLYMAIAALFWGGLVLWELFHAFHRYMG